MRVFYRSAFTCRELTAGGVLHTIPSRAILELERGEAECVIQLNGRLLDSAAKTIPCDAGGELVIHLGGEKYTYLVKPLARPLSNQYRGAYKQFAYEYSHKHGDEIACICSGALKLYAVEQSTSLRDWTDLFDQIETAFPAFRTICEKPKSHLKAVNEVRSVETVKRIGYESIPYLAAHSEDWLARTASGLKPARLFSRVEDDEYQIYENRVIKTLVDQVLSLLHTTEKELRDQYEQLHSIMNSSVQTGSFGFDVTFQKAVSELLTGGGDDTHRTDVMERAGLFHQRALRLLKKYRSLRQSRLYPYLKRSRAVHGPLRETNMLLMDRNYNAAFKLWKVIHGELAVQEDVVESDADFDDSVSSYLAFCKTLCGYTAHVLNFSLEQEGVYYRSGDDLELSIQEDQDRLRIVMRDRTQRRLSLPDSVQVPIPAGSSSGRFRFDGDALYWDNNVSDSEIEAFCSKLKTRESRGRIQAEEKNRHQMLRKAIDQRQHEYADPFRSEILLLPALAELENYNRNAFWDNARACMGAIAAAEGVSCVITALPTCREDEQRITSYAKQADEKALILPLTMYDINSFRRLQNVMLGQIVSMEKETCPCCGGRMRRQGERLVCDNCNQIILTRTICPNPACRHSYSYLSYDTPADTISRMHAVDQENFYQWDSLYQYKDTVGMSVASGKLRTVCPRCGKS